MAGATYRAVNNSFLFGYASGDEVGMGDHFGDLKFAVTTAPVVNPGPLEKMVNQGLFHSGSIA